jgi:hypothetical protein
VEVIWTKTDGVTGGGGNYKIRMDASVLAKYYSRDQIDEIGGACSMYGGKGFGGET